jgi:hypothetical protein
MPCTIKRAIIRLPYHGTYRHCARIAPGLLQILFMHQTLWAGHECPMLNRPMGMPQTLSMLSSPASLLRTLSCQQLPPCHRCQQPAGHPQILSKLSSPAGLPQMPETDVAHASSPTGIPHPCTSHSSMNRQYKRKAHSKVSLHAHHRALTAGCAQAGYGAQSCSFHTLHAAHQPVKTRRMLIMQIA